MVVYLGTHRFALLPKECQSFKKILQIASIVCSEPQNNIKLLFVHPNSSETQIECDSDLLSLKYLIKRGEINFKIVVTKSKEEIENELIENQVYSYLNSSYEEVSQKEIERQINDQLDNYFKQLYHKILVKEAKQKVKKIEKEQVSRYMKKMKSEVITRKALVRVPSIEKKSKTVKAIPQKQGFQGKETKIQSMVKRILQSMMPVMVKELSERIVGELKDSKELATSHSLRSIDEEESLEYL